MQIHWLPYRRLTLYSPMTPDEAAQALSERLFHRRFLQLIGVGIDQVSGKFEGTVSSAGFNITRVVQGRNDLPPSVYGKLLAIEVGTQVNITVITPPGTNVLFVGWLGFIVLWPNMGIVYTFMLPIEALILLILFLIIMPYYYIVRGFNYEADKAIQFLLDTFGSQNTPPI